MTIEYNEIPNSKVASAEISHLVNCFVFGASYNVFNNFYRYCEFDGSECGGGRKTLEYDKRLKASRILKGERSEEEDFSRRKESFKEL